DIRARHSFADHHAYTRRELANLQAEARRLNARLVTTEKDLVRLQPQPPHIEERSAGARLEGWQREMSLLILRDAASRLPGMRGETDALCVELAFDDAAAVE